MQKKNLLKTLAGIEGNISSSVVNLPDPNVEKMEIKLKNTIWKSNLKKQQKEWSSKTIWRLSPKD